LTVINGTGGTAMKAVRGNRKLALAVAAAALVTAGTAWQAVTTARAPAQDPVGPAAGGPTSQGFLDVATPGWTDSRQRVLLPGTDITVSVPAGPSDEPDFWNYDPYTGAKTSDASPGIAPGELARSWGGSG
jgi:hypothetical protein